MEELFSLSSIGPSSHRCKNPLLNRERAKCCQSHLKMYTEEHYSNYARTEQELLEAELAAIIQLRNDNVINDDQPVEKGLPLRL